jgi:hypothetical protein
MITLGCNIGKLTIYFSSLIYLGRITAGFSVLTGGICYIVIVVMVILRLAPCLDSLIDYQFKQTITNTQCYFFSKISITFVLSCGLV